MKFKSRFASLRLIIVLLVLILLFCFSVSWMFNGKFFLGFIIFIFTTLLSWLYFDFCYYVYDDHIVVKSGFIKYPILLDSVLCVTVEKGFSLLLSRSNESVKIVLAQKNGKTKNVFLSVKEVESFVIKLNEKCKNIVINEK